MLTLSIVIPAYNEEETISETINSLYDTMVKEKIVHEILVVNDNSKDATEHVLMDLCQHIPTLNYYNNPGPNGFGYAVRYGLDRFEGDCVAIMMADLSDDPADLVNFYNKMLSDDVDCVFGSRFVKGGTVFDYPKTKLIINRTANFIIKASIGLRYNDATNAFKLYKRHTIDGVRPFLAPHFNLTIELPLKAIVRGYSYTVLPNSWRNRKAGKSKLKIKEMGSRYLFILLYVLIEKYFTQGDFKKKVVDKSMLHV
jgi:dolichol-phosphate mannosyltransferase